MTGDSGAGMRGIHAPPKRARTRNNRPGLVVLVPVAASVPVSVATVAPIAVVPAAVPIAPAIAVASIKATPVVPVGAMPVAVTMVMVMARQAEAQVVAAPIPGTGEVPVGPAVVVPEHVVACGIVDPRHPVAVDWTVHVPVHRARSVDRPFHGHLVDDRLDFGAGFDQLHRLHHFGRHDFDDRAGIGGGVVDRHLAHRCRGRGEHSHAGFEDHHEKVEIQGTAEVDHPVGAAFANIGGGNAHLVPGLGIAVWNVDYAGCPLVDDQFGAAATPGTGNENDLAKVEVGGRKGGPFVEQGVHIEILAPVNRDVVDGNLDADSVRFGIGLRSRADVVYVCSRRHPDGRCFGGLTGGFHVCRSAVVTRLRTVVPRTPCKATEGNRCAEHTRRVHLRLHQVVHGASLVGLK